MISLPNHITDQLLDLRRPAQLQGCKRLYQLAGADGVTILTGGVRGWSAALGCGLSYPKILFAELEALEIIGVEFYPGEGGQVAEIHLQQAEPIARSIADQPPPAEPTSVTHEIPHQDAVEDPPDRSLIATPQTPLYGTNHESKQQQHDRAREDAKPDRAFLTEVLLAEFPGADRALLAAWQADPYVNNCSAAVAALAGSPRATLADWRVDLAAAQDRPGVGWPGGLVLAAWSRGERITPRRQALPPPAPRGRAAPPAESAEALRAALRTSPALQPRSEPSPARASPPGPSPGLRQLWRAAIGTLRAQIPPGEFDNWLRGLDLVALADGAATLRAPSAEVAGAVERRYATQIRRTLGDLVGAPVQLRLEAAAP
jgi:hypothetical protein